MSDLLKKIKGIFVEDTSANEAPKVNSENLKTDSMTQATSTVGANTVSTNTAFRSAMPIDVNSSDKPDEKFFDILFRALEQSNLPGYDYFEFKQTLKQLANLNMDEATRYKSAYAMAQTMGATNSLLVNTALQYIQILQNEKSKFSSSADNQRKQQIDTRKAQTVDIDKSIQDKQNMIESLNKDIASLKQKRNELNAELELTEKKWSQTTSDFERAFSFVTSEIETDITKIKNYIS